MRLLKRGFTPEFPLGPPTTPVGVEPAVKRSRSGANYDTDWARTQPARVARLALVETVLRPAVAALARPDRRGADRLHDLAQRDPVPPLVFAANHHSHLDSALLITSLPEPWRHRLFVGAAADYFFTNRVSSVVSALALNAIPIERTGVSRRSVGQAEELLRDGWSLLLFPEGGRSPDGWGQPHRPGAAWLAHRVGVPIVPVHVEGTGRILPKGSNRPRPGRTIVTFGAPLWPGDDPRELASDVERAIAALADEATGDWYAARRRAHAGQTPGLTGPDLASWRRAWALGDRKGRRSSAGPRWPKLD